MLRALLSWLAPALAAEAERTTYAALTEGSGRAVARWATDMAGQLGVEPPAVDVAGAVPAIADGGEDDEEAPAKGRKGKKR